MEGGHLVAFLYNGTFQHRYSTSISVNFDIAAHGHCAFIFDMTKHSARKTWLASTFAMLF